MSARDEVDGWASDHGVSDPDTWWGVQPVYFGPEDEPRAGGIQVWDGEGGVYWTPMDYEDYVDVMDYIWAAIDEGDLVAVVEDERGYA